MSPDGKNVTILWDVTSIPFDSKQLQTVQQALNRASYKIRTTIASARRMRSAPRLEWKNDRQRNQEQAVMDDLFHAAEIEMSKLPDQVLEDWELEKMSSELKIDEGSSTEKEIVLEDWEKDWKE
jgi:hypothetical protein